MTNKEHKLTIDDLIVEYMIEKLEKGYKPEYTGKEFMGLINLFKDMGIEISDKLYDTKKLFKRFYERKEDREWSNVVNWQTMEKQILPHIDINYDKENEDFILSANYRLKEYDRSIINIYYMKDKRVKEIRNVIDTYLKNQPKDEIDLNTKTSPKEERLAKRYAAEIIQSIWDSYVQEKIHFGVWPNTNTDINKYLLEEDYAKKYGIDSLREQLLNLYKVLCKRLAIMYHNDKNLIISTYKTDYLARHNYEKLIKDYENLMNIAFYKDKIMKLDFSKKIFEEENIVGIYAYDDMKSVVVSNINLNVKTLVRNLDNAK